MGMRPGWTKGRRSFIAQSPDRPEGRVGCPGENYRVRRIEARTADAEDREGSFCDGTRRGGFVRRIPIGILAVLLAAMLGGCAGNRLALTLTREGRTRDFLLYLPKDAAPAERLPVVFVLHGALMNASMVRWMSGMDELADEKKFIVVYPNGTGRGPLRSWNAGGVAGRRAKTVDDVQFIAALIDYMVEERNADPERIYATGLSNGGMMCYRLACELGDRIAAIAPIAGTQAIDDCRPSRPVPILHFHGTADWILPESGPGETTPRFAYFKSVEQTLAFWRGVNRCVGEGRAETLPDNEDDGTRAVRTVYEAGEGGAPVVLIRIEGGGHTWPGRRQLAGPIGRSSRDISANRMMWEFFEQNPLQRRADP